MMEGLGADSEEKHEPASGLDTGNLSIGPMGPPEELAEKIFAPRFSLKEEGRGVGLTIARRLLLEQGASINLVSDRRRRGANFEIRSRRKQPRAVARMAARS